MFTQEYIGFCCERNTKPFNQAVFGKVVRACFPNLSTRRLGVRGHSRYHYAGLNVKRSSIYSGRFCCYSKKYNLYRFNNLWASFIYLFFKKSKINSDAKKFGLKIGLMLSWQFMRYYRYNVISRSLNKYFTSVWLDFCCIWFQRVENTYLRLNYFRFFLSWTSDGVRTCDAIFLYSSGAENYSFMTSLCVFIFHLKRHDAKLFLYIITIQYLLIVEM